MSERIHVLAQQLFGKSSVAECDLQEVKALAHRFPYFAPAQFLLLEKLKQESSPDYGVQLQKAVLFYHNPLEFEYFISSDRFLMEEDGMSASQVIPGAQPTPMNEPEAFTAYEKPAEIENQQDAEEPGPDETTVPSDQPVWSDEQAYAEGFRKDEEVKSEFIEQEVNDEGTAGMEALNAPGLKIHLPSDLDKAVSIPSETAPAFEPFHTVDYFASQGIKLSQEEQPKDKFGKQLKSFTEWLKTMKRLPVPELSKAAEDSSEQKVQHLAEDSVHEADVVTEAMAEVWIKQGNRQKAAEVYRKLSLQNPSKSAYFAAKIEHLNSL